MLARKEILIVHEIDAKRLVEREFNVVLRKQTLEEEMRMFKEFEFFIEGLYEMIFPGAKYRRASRTKVWDFFKKIEYKILTTVYYEHLEAEKCPKSVLESIYKYIVKYKINYRKLIGPDAAKIIDDCRWKFYGNTAKGSEIVARIEVAQRDYAMFGVANTIGEWQRIMMVLMDIHPWGTDRLKFLVDYFGPERQWLLIKILERHGTKPFPANLLDAGSKTARDLINRVRELSPEAAKIKLSDPVSTLGYEVEGIIADWRKNDLKSAWAKWERIVVKVLGMTNGKFDLNLLYKYFFKFDAPGLLVKIFEKFHLGRYPEAAKRNPEIIPLDTKLTSEMQGKKQQKQSEIDNAKQAIITATDTIIKNWLETPIEKLSLSSYDEFSKLWKTILANLKILFPTKDNSQPRITNLEKVLTKEQVINVHKVETKFSKRLEENENVNNSDSIKKEINDIADSIIEKWNKRKNIKISEEFWWELWRLAYKLKIRLKKLDKNSNDFSKLKDYLTEAKVKIIFTIIATLGSYKYKSDIKNSLLDGKKTGSGNWKIIRNNQKRAIAYAQEPTASLKSLADIVGLEFSEIDKWLKLGKNGNYTVPNVWITADVLKGESILEIITGIGGIIGRNFNTYKPSGAKEVMAYSIKELYNKIYQNRGNIYGMVLYAHGNKYGYISDEISGGNITHSRQLINSFKVFNTFKIAEVHLMQCNSIYAGKVSRTEDGTDAKAVVDWFVKRYERDTQILKMIKGKKPKGFIKGHSSHCAVYKVDWYREWKTVAIIVDGYVGLNVMLIDADPIEKELNRKKSR